MLADVLVIVLTALNLALVSFLFPRLERMHANDQSGDGTKEKQSATILHDDFAHVS